LNSSSAALNSSWDLIDDSYCEKEDLPTPLYGEGATVLLLVLDRMMLMRGRGGMGDTPVLGAGARKSLGVRIPPPALCQFQTPSRTKLLGRLGGSQKVLAIAGA
jgi:hypothetical protein